MLVLIRILCAERRRVKDGGESLLKCIHQAIRVVSPALSGHLCQIICSYLKQVTGQSLGDCHEKATAPLPVAHRFSMAQECADSPRTCTLPAQTEMIITGRIDPCWTDKDRFFKPTPNQMTNLSVSIDRLIAVSGVCQQFACFLF
ncbi:hypothetical protein T11_11998 [Trichinella zimbabwensis]|uniref:Uncharacterized protein n=1 Tax=Trichinella zimbabwensis TaxID=268475 RepID=A0A0V1GT45_9BILA|nr:hypothetical protein T11_11998 [Trichinella zimbabwensis]